MDKLKVRLGVFTVLEVKVDKEVLKMFEIALKIRDESMPEVIEKMMGSYVSSTFGEVARLYEDNLENDDFANNDEENKYYAKALGKISKWAFAYEQVPYKIIRAFLQLQSEYDFVTLDILSERCSNKDYLETFVEQFMPNFNQLKYDTERSYGKVFIVDKETNVVSIWEVVLEKINENRNKFLRDL